MTETASEKGGCRSEAAKCIQNDSKRALGAVASSDGKDETEGNQKDKDEIKERDDSEREVKEGAKRPLTSTSSSSSSSSEEEGRLLEKKKDERFRSKVVKKRRKNVGGEKTEAAAEDRRKRKPSEGDEVDGGQWTDPDCRKRLKQGSVDENLTAVDSAPFALSEVDGELELEVVTTATPGKAKLADLVNCGSGLLDKSLASTIVDITRGHDLITEALPSSSLHSSQEDLTTLDPEKPEIYDLDGLRSDQAKNLRRAKAMIAAAFSEDDSEGEG